MGSSDSGVGLSSIFTIFIFILFLINPSSSVKVCKPASCNDLGLGPQVRFPFRLRDKQDERCGYPGFDLYCNNGQTILPLPHSGEFIVNWINYSAQSIYINDPDSCLPRRIFNFSVEGSAFSAGPGDNYYFFNCSMDWSAYSNTGAVPLFCLSDYNSTILVTPTRYSLREMPPTCRLMPNISVPLQLLEYSQHSENYIEEALKLIWNEPACQICDQNSMYCGFKSDKGLDIGCAKPPRRGLPRGAKYGIILGIGIPGLVCFIGLVCFVVGKFRYFGQRRILDTGSSSAAALNPPPSVTISGLDAPTIESYPKTVLGESCRLPEQCCGSCPICLSEYQPKETLRSIPECNHYFHASCIDEWLKLNGTCPLCRNSPESNSVTPCSPTSSAFSTSSEA